MEAVTATISGRNLAQRHVTPDKITATISGRNLAQRHVTPDKWTVYPKVFTTIPMIPTTGPLSPGRPFTAKAQPGRRDAEKLTEIRKS